MIDVFAPILLPSRFTGIDFFRWKMARHILLGLGLIAGGLTVAPAQTRYIEASAPDLIESGAPLFEVRSYQTLGLDAPPTDLHVLPDGRLLLIAGNQIAFGDGVRWERFHQASDDPLAPAAMIAVDDDGKIYMGVVGGFARVEFGADARWRLQLVASWAREDPLHAPILHFVTHVGAEWFWHGDSGPLVAWRPGQTARVMGRADTIEEVIHMRGSYFMSDRTSGRLWRLAPKAMEPVEYSPDFSSMDTFTCAVPFGPDQLLVGTYGRGIKVFDGSQTRDFVNTGHLGEGTHINALCETSGGLLAAAVEGYGLVFLDQKGRTIQVLTHRLDHQLNHIRQLCVTGGSVVGLMSEGIVRVEFPSRLSFYEPLVATRLTNVDPARVEGRLWLNADGNMVRGIYDQYGLIAGFEADTPPGHFVFSHSDALGFAIANTERGTYRRNADGWAMLFPQFSNMRILGDVPRDGRWLYAAHQEIGWLRPTAQGFVVEKFPAPGFELPYDFEIDEDESVWIEQGNARVARILVTDGKPQVEIFGLESGMREGWAQIFSLNGKVRFSVGGQILRFSKVTRRFEPDEKFAQEFPGLVNITGRPARDALGRVWITANGSVQVFAQDDGQWRNLHEPMPPGFLPYSFFCEKGGVMWMHSDRRLVRFDPSLPPAPSTPFRALITHLNFSTSGKTEYLSTRALPPINFSDNSFAVHFVAPNCPFGSSIDFEVRLEGVDSQWSSTGAGGAASFSHLKPGSYVLHVRPRAAGATGAEAALALTVLPPWFLTKWAYLGYVLGVIGLTVLIVRIASILERREKARLERLVEERTQELNAGIERRRRLEAQLLQAQKLESLGTLAGGIAHDFNNILTSILGYCELATYSAGDKEAVCADVQQIRIAGLRARDLVAQILTFSRSRKITLVPLDLAELIGDALKLVRASTPTSVEIISRLTSGTVQADSTQIHQIVINLCQNAVHSMSGRSGRIEIGLERIDATESFVAELPNLPAGPTMRLKVTDNGSGMDAATLDRVFDPFFTTKAPGEGTGLGLSIVQGIVQSHRGALRVRSKPAEGTVFEIFIPVTTAPIVVRPPAGVVPKGNLEEILVVDDEPSVATYVAKQLEYLNYRPTMFSDPHAALAEVTARPRRFRAMVSDLTMPGLTGVELVQRCRAAGADLPVVIITGYGTDAVRSALQSLTRCKILSKPFEGDDLARLLHQVMRD